MAPTRIHHVNFVVRDLETAAREFEKRLGLAPFEAVDHAPRGARVARAPLGDSWIVLVCPYEDDSVPGRFLAAHGEGFFLLSVGTTGVEEELGRLAAAGVAPSDAGTRDGILDWRVADIGEIRGALFQLTEDG